MTAKTFVEGKLIPCPECEGYPMYGVGPHECYWRKGPEFQIGQSTILPESNWPSCFFLEEGATPAYGNNCGVYYCPECMNQAPRNADEAKARGLQWMAHNEWEAEQP